jgi:hypothetical protein
LSNFKAEARQAKNRVGVIVGINSLYLDFILMRLKIWYDGTVIPAYQ